MFGAFAANSKLLLVWQKQWKCSITWSVLQNAADVVGTRHTTVLRIY